MKENKHNKSIQEVVADFDTDLEQGLKREEIQKRKERYGENALQSKAKKSLFAMIVDQFKDFMILILIIAAIISILLGDAFEGVVILGIVVLNAVLGTYQENKASNALAALKNMAAPKAKVIRDHHIMSISSKDLVPGDLVVLEAGDYIPADVRLVESVNLKVDESALTGESVAVEKDADAIVDEEAALGDRINSGYMSTIVTYGRGKAVVIGTGMHTEIGQIATMLDETEDTQTPLQNKLAQFGKYLGVICIVVSAVIFALGILRGEDLFEIFMIAVSLAVAAIPEGLPAVVTVVLAMGMQRMIKRHAIVKQLSAVETLGSTSTICTDKTGTLTQNKMTVQKVYNGYEEFEVTGTGYSFDGEIKSASGHDAKEQIKQLLHIAALCNDADFDEGDVVGDPTEGALLVLGEKGGISYQQMNQLHPRLKEYPFDSDRKLMSTLHKFDKEHLMFTKGAPDVILKRSTKILHNNEIIELTDEKRNELLAINKQYAQQALRVLGYAYKPVSETAKLEDEEQELIFAGLSGMIDPPREEVKDAIKLCKKAGIRVVMITGDHIITASAIGRQIGVIDDDSQAMEGATINKYTDEELQEAVKNTNIFARVSPEHKVRIVKALRASGEVVSMTGDGVNDAPALKQADIGVAMGITGTDVSKEAADMILTDDNFASIVDAVEEGRIIYSNIRKFVGFLLSCNIGEILIIFIAILLKWPVPLLPIQLLWVNLVTDSFPAFALGLEEGGEGIMDQKPRDKDEPIVNRTMQVSIAIQSIGLMTATLISFRIGLNSIADAASAEALARTFCFVTLIIGEMLRAYSARSEHKPLWTMRVFSNRYLNLSVTGAVIMLLGVIYLPGVSTIFSTVALSFEQLLIAMGLGVIPTVFSEIGKQINMLGAKK
ncbi:calcium-translocating P-type ATPase, SERCA-type [Vallitaleaceae bacterium 9-2]